MSYSHVLLDLDGTVYVGDRALPGAPEAIRRLRAAGVRLAFVTNDPVSARGDYERRLGTMGVAAGSDEVVTAAWATAQLVAEEHPGARVLALGSAAWRQEHADAGLRPVDDPRAADVLSLGGDVDFGYEHLRDAVRAVLAGAAFYAGNKDRTFPDVDGPSPGAGAMVAAVEYATGATARVAGKPGVGMFHEARRLLGAGTYVMCGDRVDADVAGGAAAGMDTALVLTGSTRRADLERWTGAAPTHVLGSIGDLPPLCRA
jgi:HAD superfamily hydrolase (TIGR01450 family)